MDIPFIDPVPAVIEEAERISGKGIEFIQQDDIPAYVVLQMARNNMPSHLIYHKKEHYEIINHLIVHECGHLLRTYKCPEDQRRIPYTNQQIKYDALRKIENEIVDLTKVLAKDRIAHMIYLWYTGLLQQITNFPPDIMIEKWIFDQFPMLRSLQLESIRRQHAQALSGLTESASKIAPPTILFASNVMNYAFFRILGLYIGENFIRQYSSTIYLRKGKELASLTEKDYADNHEGDNIMIEKWASLLNISDWFKWRGFEDVPPDYIGVGPTQLTSRDLK